MNDVNSAYLLADPSVNPYAAALRLAREREDWDRVVKLEALLTTWSYQQRRAAPDHPRITPAHSADAPAPRRARSVAALLALVKLTAR